MNLCKATVICPVRGTYNHIKIFLLNKEKTAFKLASWPIVAIVKSIVVSNFSVDSEILIFSTQLSDGDMCTITGTCHQEIIWPQLIHWTIPLSYTGTAKSIQKRQFRGKNIEHYIFWFADPSFIFLKICQMVICPVRGTYNHVQIFFAHKF